MLFYYLFCKKDLTCFLIFVILYTERERKTDRPETGKKGKKMKNYKINLSMYKGKVREVVSEAIQEKAFQLGYEWSIGKEAFWIKSPYLFFDEGGRITHYGDAFFFKRHSGDEISADDFLDFNPEEDFKP